MDRRGTPYIVCSLIAFGLSCVLPALRQDGIVRGNPFTLEVPGWVAFLFSPFFLMQPDAGWLSLLSAAWLSNLVFVPGVVSALGGRLRPRACSILVPASVLLSWSVAPLFWLASPHDTLLLGYYLWAAAVTFAAVGLRQNAV